MSDLDDTLWRVSAYEKVLADTGTSVFARHRSSTVLSTVLATELDHLRYARRADDVMEVVAACLRQRENALVLLRHNDLVWPVTLAAERGLYHVPRPIVASLEAGNLDLQVIGVEPAGLRPSWDGSGPEFLPLAPLLWALALFSPRPHLLEEIAGRAAFRLAANFRPDPSALSGALGPALRRLHAESASLADIARWHGMDRERAVRLLNGVYLQGGLMVLRAHHAARSSSRGIDRLRRWLRP